MGKNNSTTFNGMELKPNTVNDNKTYDLLGREIFEVPKGTIYIKNRKKFIK